MQRRFIIAALGVLFVSVPLRAQHGGHGGMSGGSHGGAFGGGYAGHPGGAPIGRPSGAGTAFGMHAAPASSGGYAGWNHGGHYPYRYGDGYRPHHGRYSYDYYWRWGYRGWGYPSTFWLGAWSGYYGDPGWYDNGYSYSYPPTQSYPVYPEYTAPDAYVSADQQNQIDRLKQQVAQLQDEEAQSTMRAASPKATIHGETVLVYRDKHTEEIENYAITGKTLWIFNEQRARKVPLSALDLPATTKANADRGTDFLLP